MTLGAPRPARVGLAVRWPVWRRIGGAVLAAGLLVLTGCAQAPVAPADGNPPLAGRLSVRVAGQPERSVSAGFELSGSADSGSLQLSGPLGTTAAQARWSAGQAVLARPGSDDTRFASLDALAAAALGEAIPMAALFDWLRGRAWPGAPATARADGVAGFEQLGWQINLARWADGWVDAHRAAPPAVTVQVRLDG